MSAQWRAAARWVLKNIAPLVPEPTPGAHARSLAMELVKMANLWDVPWVNALHRAGHPVPSSMEMLHLLSAAPDPVWRRTCDAWCASVLGGDRMGAAEAELKQALASTFADQQHTAQTERLLGRWAEWGMALRTCIPFERWSLLCPDCNGMSSVERTRRLAKLALELRVHAKPAPSNRFRL